MVSPTKPFLLLWLSLVLIGGDAFTQVSTPSKRLLSSVSMASLEYSENASNVGNQLQGTTTSRRRLMQGFAALASCTLVSTMAQQPAAAIDEGNIPMLTIDEFLIILRVSAKSIQRVEFSGPQAETVRVKLIDGTVFGLSDVIESPTDPRSPLKVQAACREAKVPFKNLQIEAILATAPKKTKLYTNQRVQEAAVKEKERLERLARDEEERLAELFRMEEKEAKRTGASSSS